MADVFISYAREDRAQAEQVANGLAALGVDSFWDTDIPPGQTWADYIESKLAQCKIVVVLWTEHSTKSQWVREEARMGRDKSKLIPVRLDGSAAPFGFGEVQAADLSAWRGEPNHPEWLRFASAVRNAVGAPSAPQPPTPPPVAPPAPQPQAEPGWRAEPPKAAFPTQQAAAPASGVEQLSPVGYVQKCLRLYINGQGRARRAEFGWFFAFAFVVGFVAAFIDVGGFGIDQYTGAPNDSFAVTILAGLALVAPTLSAASRRAHDFGQSGWLAILCAVPYIGFIATLVFIFLPGQPGANQYGPNPKEP